MSILQSVILDILQSSKWISNEDMAGVLADELVLAALVTSHDYTPETGHCTGCGVSRECVPSTDDSVFA